MAVAPTLSLLQWKPPRCNPARYPIQPPPPPNNFPTPLHFRFPRLSVNCCLPSKNSTPITANRKRDETFGVIVDMTSSPTVEWRSSYSTPDGAARWSVVKVHLGAVLFLVLFLVWIIALGLEAFPLLVPFFIISMGLAALIGISMWLEALPSGFGSHHSEVEKTSVLKLQVGLQGTVIRSLQKDLNRVTGKRKSKRKELNRVVDVSDTSTLSGLGFVLTEATLALLRHPDYCISGYSSVEMKRSMEDLEERFNQLSVEERGKFDEETLVNANNIRKQSSRTRSSDEYTVVTILVAAKGVHKLPAINGSGDLKEALYKLSSISSRKLLVVKVLWNPQNDNDTLSERELLEHYPLLRPL